MREASQKATMAMRAAMTSMPRDAPTESPEFVPAPPGPPLGVTTVPSGLAVGSFVPE